MFTEGGDTHTEEVGLLQKRVPPSEADITAGQASAAETQAALQQKSGTPVEELVDTVEGEQGAVDEPPAVTKTAVKQVVVPADIASEDPRAETEPSQTTQSAEAAPPPLQPGDSGIGKGPGDATPPGSGEDEDDEGEEAREIRALENKAEQLMGMLQYQNELKDAHPKFKVLKRDEDFEVVVFYDQLDTAVEDGTPAP